MNRIITSKSTTLSPLLTLKQRIYVTLTQLNVSNCISNPCPLAYTRTHTHTHARTHTHTYIHTHIHTLSYTRAVQYTYVHTCMLKIPRVCRSSLRHNSWPLTTYVPTCSLIPFSSSKLFSHALTSCLGVFLVTQCWWFVLSFRLMSVWRLCAFNRLDYST